jgi:hypothetical protein
MHIVAMWGLLASHKREERVVNKQSMNGCREYFHYQRLGSSVYWRKMLRAKTILILMCLILGFVLSQEFEVSSNEPPMLLLETSGSVTGIDGVMVDAVYAELKEPIELTIERIDNPATLIPFPSATKAKPITGFYQVRSPKRNFIYPGELTVGIPHPEGAPKEGLAVAFLVQGGEDSANDDEYQWSFTPATYAPATNEIAFGLKYAGPEGMPFVIVSGRYLVQ